MSDPKYADVGDPYDKVVEEIGELLQAMMKAKRFGLFNHHPDRPNSTNMDDIRREMDDVESTFGKLESHMIELRAAYFKEQSK